MEFLSSFIFIAVTFLAFIVGTIMGKYFPSEYRREMDKKDKLMKAVEHWAASRFNDGRFDPDRTVFIVNHLTEEVQELKTELQKFVEFRDEVFIEHIARFPRQLAKKEQKLEDQRIQVKYEIVDCQIMLDNITYLMEISAKELCDAEWDKLEVNKKREWIEPDEDGVIRHKK